MKVYLAGGLTTGNIHVDKIEKVLQELKNDGLKIYILESFFGMASRCRAKNLSCYADSFMLDSGAFSFLSSGKNIDCERYVARYIEYIKANNISLFFELDIDKIVGYDRVKEIRRRLERETGKRPIPVWHKHLGKQEFLRMCDEYDYVAIGGFAIRDIKITEYKYIPCFIDEAHKRGAKIHGLGFTNLRWLNICHFDSVDSSSWSIGNRYGRISFFYGRRIMQHATPKSRRGKSLPLSIHNLTEWVKFSNWAETYL